MTIVSVGLTAVASFGYLYQALQQRQMIPP